MVLNFVSNLVAPKWKDIKLLNPSAQTFKSYLGKVHIVPAKIKPLFIVLSLNIKLTMQEINAVKYESISQVYRDFSIYTLTP